MNHNMANQPEKIDRLLLKGGRLIDPSQKMDQQADILIAGKRIEKIGSVKAEDFNGKIVDCKDRVIVPGFIDMHVHLREPGREDKETIETGSHAAMAGGFTEICCMPNTHPPIDSRGSVEFIKKRTAGFLVDVHPIGAMTKDLKGLELTEMADMAEAGAVGFSDDGHPVEKASVFRNALEYANMLGRPVIDHCEELSFSEGGCMNESLSSTKAGLKAIPSLSEDIHVARDILIAEYTDTPVHIAHVSTQGAVRLIREAKKRGVRVTAETCPHYFVLNDEAVLSYDTNTKMKPPLRTEDDRKAIVEGLKDGTLDVIATDHAPHTFDEKETEFDAAAFGIIGLETVTGLVLTHLYGKKLLALDAIVNKMAICPRQILNRDLVVITEGAEANLTLLDLSKKWTVDKTRFLSKSRNTPFDGWQLTGESFGVINNGQSYLKRLDKS